MIYALIIFGLFVVSVVVYAGKTFHWLVDESVGSVAFTKPYFKPMIIEKAYRMETIKTMFEYATIESFERNRFYMGMDFADKIVTSVEHKQHMIERQAHKLTQEMLRNGFIEMTDIERGSPDYHPYFTRTMLTARVYRPE